MPQESDRGLDTLANSKKREAASDPTGELANLSPAQRRVLLEKLLREKAEK